MFTYSMNVILLAVFFLYISSFTPTEAYGSNLNGHITIKWDVLSWTPDGYVGVVTIYNFQKQRNIQAPGWQLGWTWASKEVIWAMVGGQATNQGNCSKFRGSIPHSCVKSPIIVDLKPGTPLNQQIEYCCRGGVLASWSRQDLTRSISAFQISVGQAGTTNGTVKLPKNITFKAPGGGYSCGPAKIVKPTLFFSADRRRVTQAIMTWNVTCLYSSTGKTLAQGVF